MLGHLLKQERLLEPGCGNYVVFASHRFLLIRNAVMVQAEKGFYPNQALI